MTELSADWVLPVDGPPIEGGRVRFEDGRLVEVGPGRAERHFADAVIVPGFVNAHSHLEYSVYAGFGDGFPFGPWIELHMERKGRLGPEEMLAIARRGVLDSLASGITTTADYSFSGAAATAAAAARPARDRLPRGVRQRSGRGSGAVRGDARCDRARARWCGSASRRTPPIRCSLDVYAWCLSLGVPVGTHLAESANENEWLEHGTGPLSAIAPILQPPSGARAVATLEPVLGPDLLCAHCVEVDADEIALLAERRRAGGPLPTLERAPRVRHRPTRRSARSRGGRRPRNRLAGLGAVVRRLRGDAGRDLRRPGPRAARRRPARRRRAGPGDRSRRPAHCELDAEVGTLTPGKRADLAVVSLAGSPYHPVEDPAAAVVFGGSPERVVETIVDGQTRYTSEESNKWREVRSTASAARRQMLAPRRVARSAEEAEAARSGRSELFFQRLRNHAKWMFVLLALAFALGFVFFGVGSGSTGISDVLQNALNFGSGGGTSISKPAAEDREAPAGRDMPGATSRPPTSRSSARRTPSMRSSATARCGPKDQGALAELASEYGTLATNASNDYSNAQLEAAGAVIARRSVRTGRDDAVRQGVQQPGSAAGPDRQPRCRPSCPTKQQTAYTTTRLRSSNAEAAYKRLSALNPNDATTQIQLGQAAQAANDTAVAVAAYRKFLKLAPNDPLAAQVKRGAEAASPAGCQRLDDHGRLDSRRGSPLNSETGET